MKRKTFLKDLIIKNIGSWILIVPSVMLFVLMVWQPLLSSIRLSFYETQGFQKVRFTGLSNYISVLTNSGFIQTLVNTCLYVLWSLVIGFLFPLVVAIMLNELVHWKGVFRFCCYFPSMIPGMATALMWYFIFDPGEGGILNIIRGIFGLGQSQWLLNAKLAIPLIVVTMTWRGFGGTMLIYLASLQGINRDLYEAASIDGAGFLQRIRYILLPSIRKLAGLMLIRQIIGVFQVMQEPLAMTDGGPNNASMSLMLSSYKYGFVYYQAGRAMAVGTITFLILAVLTAIYQVMSGKGDD